MAKLVCQALLFPKLNTLIVADETWEEKGMLYWRAGELHKEAAMHVLKTSLISLALILWAGEAYAETLEMFSADWCKYCQQAKADLLAEGALVDKYRLEIIDVDRAKELAKDNNIKTLPTFILRDDEGKEIARQTGYHGLRKFKRWLENHTR
jgi:thiol-disulfide isomerase/thioredoxin